MVLLPAIKPAPNTDDWHFFIPSAFTRALDRIRSSKDDTSSLSGVFATGDTFYDTKLAYQVWSEAIVHIRRAVVVLGDSAGMISFRVDSPVDGVLQPAKTVHSLKISAFVTFLRTGVLP